MRKNNILEVTGLILSLLIPVIAFCFAFSKQNGLLQITNILAIAILIFYYIHTKTEHELYFETLKEIIKRNDTFDAIDIKSKLLGNVLIAATFLYAVIFVISYLFIAQKQFQAIFFLLCISSLQLIVTFNLFKLKIKSEMAKTVLKDGS